MASRWRRWRGGDERSVLVPSGRARRSCAWRRISSVVDELDKALHQKARNRVKRCRVSARVRGETTRGLGIALAHRKSKFSPAATAELRRRMRVAWWLSGRLVWGKRKRTERGISRGRRRGKGSSKSLVIVRINPPFPVGVGSVIWGRTFPRR